MSTEEETPREAFPKSSSDPSSEKVSSPVVHDPSASAAPPSSAAFISALLQFCVASVSMVLGNKMAVDIIRLPCTLVVIQAIGTLFLLAFCRNGIATMRLSVVKDWLPIAMLFALMLFSSLKSFMYVNVSTVIIFRNVGALFTTFVEFYVRHLEISSHLLVSELVIVAGAVMYGAYTASFSWVGTIWILINVAGQVSYGVLLKYKMDTHQQIKEMSKYTMSLYNNALGLPMVMVVLFIQREHTVMVGRLLSINVYGWLIIAVTCFFGFFISTSGFGLQKLVSATTFIVINNLTKFLNILLSIVILRDRYVGVLDTTGCLVALCAGCWYSVEQHKLNTRKLAAKG